MCCTIRVFLKTLQEDANDSEDEGAVFLDLTGLKRNKQPEVLDNVAVLVEYYVCCG